MVDVEVVAVRHFVRQFRPAFVAGIVVGRRDGACLGGEPDGRAAPGLRRRDDVGRDLVGGVFAQTGEGVAQRGRCRTARLSGLGALPRLFQQEPRVGDRRFAFAGVSDGGRGRGGGALRDGQRAEDDLPVGCRFGLLALFERGERNRFAAEGMASGNYIAVEFVVGFGREVSQRAGRFGRPFADDRHGRTPPRRRTDEAVLLDQESSQIEIAGREVGRGGRRSGLYVRKPALFARIGGRRFAARRVAVAARHCQEQDRERESQVKAFHRISCFTLCFSNRSRSSRARR